MRLDNHYNIAIKKQKCTFRFKKMYFWILKIYINAD